MIEDDVPQIYPSAAYACNQVYIGDGSGSNFGGLTTTTTAGAAGYHFIPHIDHLKKIGFEEKVWWENIKPPYNVEEHDMAKDTARYTGRIVRCFLIDPDPKVPVDKKVIFRTEETITDLTDEELRHEQDLKKYLAAQNEYRATAVDREMTEKMGKEMFLQPIRLRDLQFHVVTVIAF